IVQRDRGRGAYPPIGRPSVSSLQINRDDIVITSRAANESNEPPATLTSYVPHGALLAASFVSPPHAIGDLNRLFGAKVSSLLADGGTLALYDVNTGTLLPRPIGVIALPADDAHRATLQSFLKNSELGQLLGIHPQTAE